MAIKFIDGVQIESIACTVAKKKVAVQDYVADLFPTEKSIKRFTKTTGFTHLRISDDNVTTADLSAKSAEMILSETAREEIEAIVFLTQTPDYVLPATGHILQDRLALKRNILCIDANEGCAGYVTGLYLAAVIANNLKAKVLLVGGDTSSKVTYSEDRTTRSIFGDAGFATLISPNDKKLAFDFQSYGNLYDAIIMENSRHRIVDNPKNNSLLYMDGNAVMDFSLDEVPEAVENFLRELNLTTSDISLFACHQPNKLILESLAKELKVPNEKLPFIAAETGNTSSASIPLMLSTCADKDLNQVLCVGFGIGMAIGICMADFSQTKFYEVTEL